MKLSKHQHRIGPTLHFFNSSVVNVWNALPESVVSARTLPVFKERLKSATIDAKFLRGDGADED